MDANLFAVTCTADIEADRLNTFFTMSYENGARMDCQPCLLLVNAWDDLKVQRELTHTIAPVDLSGVRNSFIGKPLKEIALELRREAAQIPSHTLSTVFAVLDERSRTEDNALIVEFEEGELDTARVHFDTVNAELIRIGVITGNVGETRMLAENEPDGVLRTKALELHEQGGPAPRKKLAADPADR
ncbi:hypothetical protein LTR37_015926 [Vermiconidia calcicola]|uniref:Uncharacterized protein n=1 Tax=Vermiconidia calcicola TaxID=1690605 RepID=A0ACC3MPB8_9PEZI|nr:hypothetical protein LTR37_015926 [Vermiconidia calcicola]